jgi:hypothetical protein
LNKWKTVWNCEFGSAQCYNPDPLKPIAPGARSDRASVMTTPPSSGLGRRRLLPPLRPHHRCQHSPSTVRPGHHLLEGHTIALVLPGPGIDCPRPCTVPSQSRFTARVASPYTNLLVSFLSSPRPKSLPHRS